jgi:hypothetical protein
VPQSAKQSGKYLDRFAVPAMTPLVFSQPNRRSTPMTNLESAAKQDVAAARTGLRTWMANHPFTWGAIACATGAAVVALIAVAL